MLKTCQNSLVTFVLTDHYLNPRRQIKQVMFQVYVDRNWKLRKLKPELKPGLSYSKPDVHYMDLYIL